MGRFRSRRLRQLAYKSKNSRRLRKTCLSNPHYHACRHSMGWSLVIPSRLGSERPTKIWQHIDALSHQWQQIYWSDKGSKYMTELERVCGYSLRISGRLPLGKKPSVGLPVNKDNT